MITLHQYPPAFNLPSLSPFCIKVEFFLKVAKLPYQVKVERNPARGPKGKMPFIVKDSMTLADSSFIIDHLIKTHSLDHLEVKIERSQMIAFKALIEESLYFILLYSRWVDEKGFNKVLEEFIPLFPPFIGKPFLSYIKRNLTAQSIAQGLGRHSLEEVYEIGRRQIEALAEFLGDKEYFFENKITSFDATSYAFLSTIIKQPINSPLKFAVLERTNLCAYVTRLDAIMES